MIDEIFAWLGVALGVLAVAMPVVAIATRPRGARCRCPGPRASIVARLGPRRLFVRGRCWYDLTGLPVTETGVVRCPECGRSVVAARALADGCRVRFDRLAAMSLLLFAITYVAPAVCHGNWVRPLPTLAIAVIEHAGVPAESDVRDEVERRIGDRGVSGASAELIAGAIARDLADDDVRWNAIHGERLLRDLWPLSRNALEAALEGTDAQARVVAARILRQRCGAPSDALLRATILDLRDDGGEVNSHIAEANATAATEYLLDRAHAARPHLVDAMRNGDWQQRLVAAAIVAHAGLQDHLDLAAPILIDHLRDNDRRADASIAAPALYALGPAVSPYLLPHVDSDDEQLRKAALAILERIEHPDLPADRLRHGVRHITGRTSDPLVSLDLPSSVRNLDR